MRVWMWPSEMSLGRCYLNNEAVQSIVLNIGFPRFRHQAPLDKSAPSFKEIQRFLGAFAFASLTQQQPTMRAVVLQQDRTVRVQERPQPTITSKQILIKNSTFGQNPSDWKHAAFLSPVGAIMGVDAVGAVVNIGDEVPAEEAHIYLGQRRGLFMRGGMEFDNGPFAEYTAMDYDLTFAVPNNITDEEAATLPAPYWTAVQCLYHRLDLPEPVIEEGEEIPQSENVDDKWILVWSGMSSVAQFVVQLAKLSGCKVVTTASPSRWSHLEKLGADVCIDYKVGFKSSSESWLYWH